MLLCDSSIDAAAVGFDIDTLILFHFPSAAHDARVPSLPRDFRLLFLSIFAFVSLRFLFYVFSSISLTSLIFSI